ncbi:MAG: iron ABC transporter permease [Rhodocyclaceae bacterium]|nr:iron ABC transporter permease [Rhodocyclaceae bacterium]
MAPAGRRRQAIFLKASPSPLPSSRLLPVAAFLVAVLVAMPVLSVAANLLAGGTGETWSHLASTVLGEYVLNSLVLCLGVGMGTAMVGTGAAWLVAMHDFPGKRVFEWALLLPLAMPAYVLAYTYTDFLQFVGPVQTGLRESFDWRRDDYWFPDVRSLPGAVVLFVCALYPYVYLLARTAFLERASGMIEVARALGLGPWAAFRRVSLPLARPAIAAGVALALMETLADYGTVAYFAVPTFTTGIYRAWFSLGDRAAAAQLAALLLGFVLLLLAAERLTRGRARYHDTTGRRRPFPGRQLRGWRALFAWLGCLVPLAVGFLIPGGLLLRLAVGEREGEFGQRFWTLAGNSLTLAMVASCLAVALALVLGYAARGGRGLLPRLANRVVGLGYAVPGSVIAVGVLIPVTRLDHFLAGIWQQLGGSHPGLLLTGGIAALVYAYLARFLSIALQTVEAGLGKITPSMDDAARSLGFGSAGTLRKVHLPLLRGSLLTALLLVFVDVMKELPATLVMRPFNFDTLATQTYTLAADERLAEASIVALAIVAVGLLPIGILARQIAGGRTTDAAC